jgi:hypothetical protein
MYQNARKALWYIGFMFNTVAREFSMSHAANPLKQGVVCVYQFETVYQLGTITLHFGVIWTLHKNK